MFLIAYCVICYVVMFVLVRTCPGMQAKDDIGQCIGAGIVFTLAPIFAPILLFYLICYFVGRFVSGCK